MLRVHVTCGTCVGLVYTVVWGTRPFAAGIAFKASKWLFWQAYQSINPVNIVLMTTNVLATCWSYAAYGLQLEIKDMSQHRPLVELVELLEHKYSVKTSKHH